jgi:hypothetical protein
MLPLSLAASKNPRSHVTGSFTDNRSAIPVHPLKPGAGSADKKISAEPASGLKWSHNEEALLQQLYQLDVLV